MKEQAYNDIRGPDYIDLNDKSNLIDLMKECHNELTSGEIVSLKILSRTMEVRSTTINRGLIQAIPTSLPPQPIGEATKASNLQDTTWSRNDIDKRDKKNIKQYKDKTKPSKEWKSLEKPKSNRSHSQQKLKSKSTPTKSKPRSHQVKENTTLGTKFAKS
ncbi:hypothetical protein Tco_0794732 [Tanacetum coccineum]